MKEAFEKLKKWFGELQKKAEDDEEVILHYEGHSLSYEFLDGRKDAFKEAQKIVSEVEAEYGNGCEKQTYEICLNGCDDDTTFKMELTENEYQFLSRVSEIANKTSTYGCMPRLYVEPYKPEKGE